MSAARNRKQSKKVEVWSLSLGAVSLWAEGQLEFGVDPGHSHPWKPPAGSLGSQLGSQGPGPWLLKGLPFCHSQATLVLWSQGSRKLQTTQRTCPGLDFPSQSSVQSWAFVLSPSRQVPSYSPFDPSWLEPYPEVQKLRALFDIGECP